MQSFTFEKFSMCCFNFFLLWLVFMLNILPEPDFQTSPSLLQLLLIDSWSELETLIFSNARRFSVRYFFFFLSAFSTCFCTMTFTSCLGYLLFFLKCFPFFCFICWNSAFNVVHSSVVCPHIPWYWQNFLSLFLCSESTSLESQKITDFLFLGTFFAFLLVSWGNTWWDWFF